jgi:hypothetical protein
MALPAVGSSGPSSQNPDEVQTRAPALPTNAESCPASASLSRDFENLCVTSPPPPPPSSSSSSPSVVPPRISLESLPNELLEPIAAFLAPLPPATTRFALRPNGTWEFKSAAAQFHDWLAARNDLIRFMQTSQRMAAVARPYLYHTLVVYHARHLVRLFQQIVLNPDVGIWIQDISCLFNVTGLVSVGSLEDQLASAGEGMARQPASEATRNTTSLAPS